MRRWPAVGAALLGALALAVAGVQPTQGAWNDGEWTRGTLGVLDCADPEGQLTTRGAGRMISGDLLGLDLDSIAEVKGTEVVYDGVQAVPDPPTARPAEPEPYAFADPLNVEALHALELELGTVSELLQLPLGDEGLAAVGQYGAAKPDGSAAGAAGFIASSGVIATADAGHGYPELATIDLKAILERVLGAELAPAIAAVADVQLETGAVAGRAELTDGCEVAYGGADEGTLSREYLLSDLDMTVESDTVGELVTGVSGVIDGLETAVNGLASDQGVIDGIASGVTALLSALTITDVQVELTADIDLAAARSLLVEPFGDSSGVLLIDPQAGTVRIDTAAVLAQAYPGECSGRLNGLPPNTDILADPAVLDTLTNILGDTLDAWVSEIEAALVEAVDAVRVDVVVDIVVWLALVGIPVEATVAGSLGDLLAGDVKAEVQALGLDLSLLAPLVNGLGGIVGTVVYEVLAPFTDLGDTVSTLATPVVEAVGGVFAALYLDGLVSLTVNAQNDPFGGPPGPGDLEVLPDGRYDVAALRIGVLDALGDARVQLYLGRGSVGPVCLVGQAGCG